jgi:antitoxin (DNA-binding transcriptional repressor) of toxin-antitoxin stability system
MGTTQVNMHEAKSRLSELGELAQKGERIVIAKAGKPYLDLLAHRESRGKRSPGRLAGRIRIAPDFDESSSELLADFEGET